MAPLVSILIPAYNAERWIADTLTSALSQTWPRKEVIVVDSGSTDNTLAIVSRFESSAVRVVSRHNKGASAARNSAFELARGDYIQWLDADDLLAPDKIAAQMQVAARVSKRELLSSAWGTFLYRPSKACFSPTLLWTDLSPVEWFHRRMTQNLQMQTANWLVSRELTEAAGPWDVRLSLDDDGEYFCRGICASDGIRFVPAAKVFYRNAAFQRLSTIDGSDEKLESQFLSIKLQVQHALSLDNSEEMRAACVKFLQIWLFCFYDFRKDLANDLEQLAAPLGGRLEVPQLRKKYRWIQQLIGRRAARRVQDLLPRARWRLTAFWDFALWSSEQLLFGPEPTSARKPLLS
jgi:glycosyltransferase involved in cell wall biosynthesis